MTTKETIRRARRRIKNGKCCDLPDLLMTTERAIEWLIPIVQYGKDMTDEFDDYPSEENKVQMEMARLRVVVASQKLSEVLAEAYDRLSASSKQALPFSEFANIVQSRLLNMLGE